MADCHHQKLCTLMLWLFLFLCSYLPHHNFIVDSLRVNPPKYLSVTAFRRNLYYDVGSILQVHGCLEQCELFNYYLAGDKLAPHMMGPPLQHTSKYRYVYVW